jgi:hypothetical protein
LIFSKGFQGIAVSRKMHVVIQPIEPWSNGRDSETGSTDTSSKIQTFMLRYIFSQLIGHTAGFIITESVIVPAGERTRQKLMIGCTMRASPADSCHPFSNKLPQFRKMFLAIPQYLFSSQ